MPIIYTVIFKINTIMPNNITKNTKVFNAEQFIESVSELENNNIYMFVGHAQPRTDESVIENITLLQGEEFSAFYNMVAAKKIQGTDMCQVVPRINWRPDQVYDFYDDRDENLSTKRFYVMNSNYDVYICLWNNDRIRSTVMPTSRSTRAFDLSDGYKWKYLYSISSVDQLKFLTTQWMPVRSDPIVQRAATPGKIEVVLLETEGSGYTTAANNIITINGDGEGLVVNHQVIDGQISQWTVLDGGAGYKYANISIRHQAGTGSGAAARVIIPPSKGHGADPIIELNAHYVMLNTKIEYAEGQSDFPIDISYRTIGLVKDPLDPLGNRVTNVTANVNYTLKCNVAPGGTFEKDQYVTGNISLANGYIITSNVTETGNVAIRYVQAYGLTSNFKNFNIGEELLASNSGSTAVVTEIGKPEIQPGTGQIIYLDRRPPVSRSPDQAENVHIVIEF